MILYTIWRWGLAYPYFVSPFFYLVNGSYSCSLVEPSDPFTSDDPFKSDPFAQFKSVSFADPFSSDPFEVYLHQVITLHRHIAQHCMHACTAQRSAALHCTPLHYTSLLYTCYTTLHYTLHYTTLHYTTLHYTTLHYTTLDYTTLHCYILTALHCIGLTLP